VTVDTNGHAVKEITLISGLGQTEEINGDSIHRVWVDRGGSVRAIADRMGMDIARLTNWAQGNNVV
jgi:hypothetical protein